MQQNAKNIEYKSTNIIKIRFLMKY